MQSIIIQKLTAVSQNGLNDANISDQEKAVLDELFTYDKNNTADGGPSGSGYDQLDFNQKLNGLSQSEIDAFAKEKGLNQDQTDTLNDIFKDAQAFVRAENNSSKNAINAQKSLQQLKSASDTPPPTEISYADVVARALHPKIKNPFF